MISKMKEITNLQIRQNGQQRKVWQTAKKNLVVLGNSLTVHFFWAQQFIGDTITQSPSWPENEKQYAVQTSRSTTTVTTLWDKQSHVYSSFENVHVYQRLNAKYQMTYMYSWYTLFRGDQGQTFRLKWQTKTCVNSYL